MKLIQKEKDDVQATEIEITLPVSILVHLLNLDQI